MFKKKNKATPSKPYLKGNKQQYLFTKEINEYSNYNIGEYTYGMPNVLSWGENAQLTIGKFCSISENVEILLGGNHRTDWLSTYPFNEFFESAHQVKGHPSTKGDVKIGNDVWIGRGAKIFSGVTIGDGAVIGAFSSIAKDINPYEIVAGNPQKHIRFRFDPQTINCLLELQWWNLPMALINEIAPILQSSNISELKEIIKEFPNV